MPVPPHLKIFSNEKLHEKYTSNCYLIRFKRYTSFIFQLCSLFYLLTWQVEDVSLAEYEPAVLLQYPKIAVGQLVPVEPHTHDLPEHMFALVPQYAAAPSAQDKAASDKK